jgi:hypothetical protein
MSDAFIGPPGFQVVHDPQSQGTVRTHELGGAVKISKCHEA